MWGQDALKVKDLAIESLRDGALLRSLLDMLGRGSEAALVSSRIKIGLRSDDCDPVDQRDFS